MAASMIPACTKSVSVPAVGRRSLPERRAQVFLTPQPARRCLPVSRSAHGGDLDVSAPSTPGDSPADSPSGSQPDILLIPEVTLGSLTPKKNSRRYWHKKILKFRDDVNKACTRFKEKCTLSRHSQMEPVVETLRDPESDMECTVEYYSAKTSRSSSRERLKQTPSDASDVIYFDSPIRDFTQSVVVTSLCDGMFEADVKLPRPPPANLRVKVRESARLSLYTRRRSHGDAHTVSVPYKFGNVHLPMYVDAEGMELRLVRGNLKVRAPMKGLGSDLRRHSLSTGDLDMASKTTKGNLKRMSTRLAKSSKDLHGHLNVCPDFRNRTFTR